MDALVNLDAEKTLLGCALSDDSSLHRVLPLVRADDFSDDYNRLIFRAISELAEAGKAVDELILTNALIANGQLGAAGGAAYVCDLSRKVDAGLARVTNVEHYAEQVRDKSRRRQARAAALRLSSNAEDPSVTTDECVQQIQETLLQIESASGKSAAAQHVRQFMPDVLRELETQSANQGLVGMTTGIRSLDLATGGIRPGELIRNPQNFCLLTMAVDLCLMSSS